MDLGTPKDKADSLFTLIEKFAGYGFNKSHSAAYALVAYQTAYLKAHYPLEFLAALLNSEITQTTSLAKHIMDAREQGLALLPPDINLSHRDFAVEDGRVRYGMAGVKNAGAGAIQELVETRKTGRFETFSDFLERVNLSRVNRKVIEALIQAGAFDNLEGNRARLLAGLDIGLERAQRAKSLQAIKQMSMFEALAESVTDDWLPETPEWEESEKLAREKEALGVYLSGHPLDAFRHILKSWVKFTAADLPDTPDGESVALGVVVSAIKEKVGKKGGRVAILTVEDLTGSVEVLVFGDLLEKMAPWLSQPSLPLWLKGDVVQEDRGTKIVAREVAPLGTSLPRWPSRLDLRLRASTLTKDQLLALRQVLDRHLGTVPSFLHFLNPRENGILALPEALALTPSEELTTELNHLFGYPVLNL